MTRRAVLGILAGAVLLASFALGLRWGLYLSPRHFDLVTYAVVDSHQDPASAPANAVLLSNGRFAVLTNHFGYVGQKLDADATDIIFRSAEQGSLSWAADYPDPSGSFSNVAFLRLTSPDGQEQTIRVEDLLTNPSVPRSLRLFLTTMTREQYRTVANGAPIVPASLPLRLFATPIENTQDPAIYDLPKGSSVTPLLAPGGYAMPPADPLNQAWHLADSLLAPANSRTIRADGRLYRLTVLVDWSALQD